MTRLKDWFKVLKRKWINEDSNEYEEEVLEFDHTPYIDDYVIKGE